MTGNKSLQSKEQNGSNYFIYSAAYHFTQLATGIAISAAVVCIAMIRLIPGIQAYSRGARGASKAIAPVDNAMAALTLACFNAKLVEGQDFITTPAPTPAPTSMPTATPTITKPRSSTFSQSYSSSQNDRSISRTYSNIITRNSFTSSIFQTHTKSKTSSISILSKLTSTPSFRKSKSNVSPSVSTTENTQNIPTITTSIKSLSESNKIRSTSLSQQKSLSLNKSFSYSHSSPIISTSTKTNSRNSFSLHNNSLFALPLTKSNTVIANNINPKKSLMTEIIDPTTVETVVTTVTSGAMVLGIIQPSQGTTVTNVLRTSEFAKNCANSDIGEFNQILYIPSIPLVLGSDDNDAAKINGAIVSTTSLMALNLLAFILTGYLKNPVTSDKTNKVHAILANTLSFILCYYGPNIVEIATLSANNFSTKDMGLSIPALGFWGAIFVGSGYLVYKKSSAHEQSLLYISPLYKPTKDFSRIPTRLVVVADMAEAYILALLSGFKSNPNSCKLVASSMITVSTLYLGYLLKIRPYKSNVEQVIASINAMLLVSTSVLNLASLYDSRLFSVLAGAEIAVLSYMYVQMAITAIIMLKSKYEQYKNSKLILEKTLDVDNQLPTLQFSNNLEMLQENVDSSNDISVEIIEENVELLHESNVIKQKDNVDKKPEEININTELQESEQCRAISITDYPSEINNHTPIKDQYSDGSMDITPSTVEHSINSEDSSEVYDTHTITICIHDTVLNSMLIFENDKANILSHDSSIVRSDNPLDNLKKIESIENTRDTNKIIRAAIFANFFQKNSVTQTSEAIKQNAINDIL